MQFLRCHTCFPATTAAVMFSSWVSRPNCLWLSIVKAMNTRVNTVVPATKKRRVCRLVILSSTCLVWPGGQACDIWSPTSYADPREVADRNPGRVQHCGNHDDNDDRAQRARQRSVADRWRLRRHAGDSQDGSSCSARPVTREPRDCMFGLKR